MIIETGKWQTNFSDPHNPLHLHFQTFAVAQQKQVSLKTTAV
jgi:hypothetical protein